VALSPGSRSESRNIGVEEAVRWPAALPDGVLDRELRELRQRIERRRQSLLDMIERDFGERSELDAWETTIGSVSSLV